MTQEEKWIARYNEVVKFIETNKRNPSKYRLEEHDMLNWLKANRKAMNAGKMKLERVEKFRKLLEMTEQYRRKNQYDYSRYVVININRDTDKLVEFIWKK